MARAKKWSHKWIESEEYVWRRPQKKRGRWRCYRRRKSDGKLSMFTLETRGSFADARAEVAGLAVLVDGSASGELAERTLDDALDEWLATLDVRPRTLEEYRSETNTYKRTFGAERFVHVIGFKDFERAFTETWRGRKGRTLLKHHGQLKRIWSWFVDSGYALENPVAKVRVQAKWRREDKRARESTGRALSVEEARALIGAALGDEALERYLVLSLLTGLRQSNILGARGHGGDPGEVGRGRAKSVVEYKPALSWHHIDWTRRVIELPADAMKNDLDFVQPLSLEVERYLRAIAPGETSVGRIVPSFQVSTTWPRLVRRSGLTGNLRPHDLRHSFAAWIGQSCPEAIAAALLGHSKSSITRRYTQNAPVEVLREALDRALPEVLPKHVAMRNAIV